MVGQSLTVFKRHRRVETPSIVWWHGTYAFVDCCRLNKTSRTRRNPGRRFHTFPHQRWEGCCAFFKWVNPKMIDRANEVILELCDCLGDYSNSNVHVPSSAGVVVEAESSIAVEVNVLKEKVAHLKRGLKMEKRKTDIVSCCLGISWLGFVIFCNAVVLMLWSDRNGGTIDAIVLRLN